MKWYDYLKSNKQHTAGEDLADSVALFIILGLVMFMVFGT